MSGFDFELKPTQRLFLTGMCTICVAFSAHTVAGIFHRHTPSNSPLKITFLLSDESRCVFLYHQQTKICRPTQQFNFIVWYDIKVFEGVFSFVYDIQNDVLVTQMPDHGLNLS